MLNVQGERCFRGSEKVYRGLIRQVPLGRFGKPSEVIGSVLLLCSDLSSYTTGTVLTLDGGSLA